MLQCCSAPGIFTVFYSVTPLSLFLSWFGICICCLFVLNFFFNEKLHYKFTKFIVKIKGANNFWTLEFWNRVTVTGRRDSGNDKISDWIIKTNSNHSSASSHASNFYTSLNFNFFPFLIFFYLFYVNFISD